MWDLIVSVPDHCLSFYFARYHLYRSALLHFLDEIASEIICICLNASSSRFFEYKILMRAG